MKHSRVIIDYEPRMAAQDAEIAALRASNAQLEIAVMDLLGRFKAMQRATELLFGETIRQRGDWS